MLFFLGLTCGAAGQVATTSQAPFTVTITAAKPEFKLGQPAFIHMVLKSASQQPIVVPGERHLGRGEVNYHITVMTMDGSALPDSDIVLWHKAGHSGDTTSYMERELNFGEDIEEGADLNRIVKITASGDYIVQVERADYKWGTLHIRSNKLVVHFVP